MVINSHNCNFVSTDKPMLGCKSTVFNVFLAILSHLCCKSEYENNKLS